MHITIRTGVLTDIPFIIATWSRSCKIGKDRRMRIPHMRRALERVMAGSGKLAVACSAKNQDTLIGWALSECGDLWWVYVSKDFRGLSIGRRLTKAVLEASTEKT
jgi:ribosomal protein S18 acetylase RimI-like enzyme